MRKSLNVFHRFNFPRHTVAKIHQHEKLFRSTLVRVRMCSHNFRVDETIYRCEPVTERMFEACIN